MATQILTRVLCDFCNAEHIETPDARTETVTIGGDTYEVDVCGTHGKPLVELAETLAEYGRKIPKRGRPVSKGKRQGGPGYNDEQDEPLPCPEPECGTEWPTRSALASHVRRVHGKTLAEYEGTPLNFKCGWCPKAFSTRQGQAVHEQRVHAVEYAARKSAQETGSDTTSI